MEVMSIKKLALQMLFVFGFIFGLTVLIIFLYNYLMSGIITIQWKIPLLFSGLIVGSYLFKYITDKKQMKNDDSQKKDN